MPRPAPLRPPAAPLTDGTVVVRLRVASDVDAVAAASRDPETRRWLADEPMDEEARRTSLARTEQAWRDGTSAPLVIADAATGEPVGLVNLQFRDDGAATIAYSVFPARRGQGLAPRAVRLVTGWALRDPGPDRLLLEADAANAASLRVAEKCGFREIERRTETDENGRTRTTVVHARDRD